MLPGATKPWLAEQELRQEKRMIVCLINYGKAKGGIFNVRAAVNVFERGLYTYGNSMRESVGSKGIPPGLSHHETH